MRPSLGVIADTHGDGAAWEKACRVWGPVSGILHCGDVLSAEPSDLVEKIRRAGCPVLIVRGNCDTRRTEERLGLPLLSPYAVIWWYDKLVLMGHGDRFPYLRQLGLAWRAHVVITGHTHVGSVVREEGTIFLNPGSASLPRGRDPASAARIDGEGIRIFTVASDETLHWEPWQ
ncbi:MAG TPA: phosphodiesterase [Synergistaceae bacterium]|jgi:hypothetical protein|nr:phosphodiesterase [Synergistaceae bacterium]